jgi:predicted transcriptional regulator
MARLQPLSKAEMEIARLVWEQGSATVRQIADALPADRDVDLKTVQTFLRRLEAKGYLKTRRDGRSAVYTPRVEQAKVVRDTVRDFTKRLFGGDALPLVTHLIEDGGLDEADIRQLRKLIDRLEQQSHERRT